MKKINIEVSDKVNLLKPESLRVIQKNLKSLSKTNYEKLKSEIIKNGFSFAIHYWNNKKDKTLDVLDGTQRLRTILEMKKEGFSCDEIPCIEVKAKDFKQALSKLLGGASSYGHFEKEGLYELMHEFEISLDELVNIEFPGLDLIEFEKEFFLDYDDKTSEEDDEIPEVKETRCKPGDL